MNYSDGGWIRTDYNEGELKYIRVQITNKIFLWYILEEHLHFPTMDETANRNLAPKYLYKVTVFSSTIVWAGIQATFLPIEFHGWMSVGTMASKRNFSRCFQLHLKPDKLLKNSLYICWRQSIFMVRTVKANLK